jgi:hypothetical protein
MKGLIAEKGSDPTTLGLQAMICIDNQPPNGQF